jgi:NAD(P)H-nitrite reductase large subunit
VTDLILCRCEEITEDEILEAIRDGASTLTDVKRRTRAGMGLCQGKTCQRLVARLLARELGCSLDKVAPPSARPPTRPLPLLAFVEEG